MEHNDKRDTEKARKKKWMRRLWLYTLVACAVGFALMFLGVRCGLNQPACVVLFCVPVLVAGFAFGVRTGQIPAWWFDPKIHFLYRGRAVGTVVQYDPFDSASVAYEVAGQQYTVTVSDKKIEKAVTDSDYHPASDTWSASVEKVYDENRLGPIGIGTKMRVRYVPGTPSRAVVLPNTSRRAHRA